MERSSLTLLANGEYFRFNGDTEQGPSHLAEIERGLDLRGTEKGVYLHCNLCQGFLCCFTIQILEVLIVNHLCWPLFTCFLKNVSPF